MIKLNVVSIMVLDQQEALDFYVDKLGLEVAQDIKQGPFRWLTVRVPGQPDIEIQLQEPGPPVQLFRPHIVGGGIETGQGPMYDVARDGRFLINTEVDHVAPITLVANWKPGGKR